MVGRAAMNANRKDVTVNNFTYFFHGSQYATIELADDKKLSTGPRDTLSFWSSFEQAGFRGGQIDAILPLPPYTGLNRKAYFFSGSSYARIQFTAGTAQETILSKGSLSSWVPLRKAGFERVDAAAIVPGTTDQAYFFKGREFCRVSFKEGTSSHDELLEGPHLIRERWSNLGFDTIDNILPSPHHSIHSTTTNHYHVFSGNRVAGIILIPGGGVDIEWGPGPAAYHYPALHQAGFY